MVVFLVLFERFESICYLIQLQLKMTSNKLTLFISYLEYIYILTNLLVV